MKIERASTSGSAGGRAIGGAPAGRRRAPLPAEGYEAQAAAMAPGGAVERARTPDAVQMRVIPNKDGACDGKIYQYADPKPFEWSVAFKREGLAYDGERAPKQDVAVQASYDWATLERAKDGTTFVAILMGSISRVTTEGRDEVERESETFQDSVDQSASRFDAAMKEGESLKRRGTRVESVEPQRTPEAPVTSCRQE